MSVSDANRKLVERAAETHNARDREAFLACYGRELRVRWGDRDLIVSPDEHWEAVLSWGGGHLRVSARTFSRS